MLNSSSFRPGVSGVYSTRNHQSTDLGCLRQSVLQRTNPRYIPTASFIVGVHVLPSSLGEGGPPLDPPISYHFFVSFFCKTDNPTQAKRPLSPPPRLLTPTHTYYHNHFPYYAYILFITLEIIGLHPSIYGQGFTSFPSSSTSAEYDGVWFSAGSAPLGAVHISRLKTRGKR